MTKNVIDFFNKGERSPRIFDNSVDRGFYGDRLLSPNEAATYCNVSRKFIYERIYRGELKALNVGRLRRIRLSTLETWLTCQNEWG